jgi:nucleotide-binding universal stress UspA family protein
MWRASKRQLDEVASYIAHHLGSGVPVATRVLAGSPEHALVEAGKGAEMVVLQPGGDPAHGLLIDPSVTTAVAARSTEPVVAVPQRWDPLVGTGTVTVALAAVAGSAHLVRTALEEARLRGATLRVLHLWYDKDAYDVFPSPQKEARSAALAEGIRRDIAPVCAAFDVPLEVVVRLGRPAEELIRASARTDLMVLARHHTGRRVSHHLGWKARAVLHDARCPVMVVDPIDRLGLRVPA